MHDNAAKSVWNLGMYIGMLKFYYQRSQTSDKFSLVCKVTWLDNIKATCIIGEDVIAAMHSFQFPAEEGWRHIKYRCFIYHQIEMNTIK